MNKMVRSVDNLPEFDLENLSNVESQKTWRDLKLLGLSKFRHRLSMNGRVIDVSENEELDFLVKCYSGKRFSGAHPCRSYVLEPINPNLGEYRFFCYDCPILDP